MLREPVFEKVIEEIRVEYGRLPAAEFPITVFEIEMAWVLHAAIFYLGGSVNSSTACYSKWMSIQSLTPRSPRF